MIRCREVKILLDHNLDWRISDQFPSTLKNGSLLTEAERSGFSVLLPSEKGIKEQQSMKGRSLAEIDRESDFSFEIPTPLLEQEGWREAPGW